MRGKKARVYQEDGTSGREGEKGAKCLEGKEKKQHSQAISLHAHHFDKESSLVFPSRESSAYADWHVRRGSRIPAALNASQVLAFFDKTGYKP